MEKILIIGNNPEAKWLENFKNYEIRPIGNLSTNRADELNAFIDTIPHDLEGVIIDSDSVEDTDLVLNIALRIRFNIHNLKHTALCRIIIVSESDFATFRDHGIGSVLLMTNDVFVSTGEEVHYLLEDFKPLTPAEYVEGFLNLIKITPDEKVEGRHSIANEWGAYILAKMVVGGSKDNIIKIRSSSSLYFCYCGVVSLNAFDIASIIDGKPSEPFGRPLKIKETFHYLLIDDEADKGWDKVLELMMPKAQGRVYPHQAEDYSALPQELRKEIEACKYDIVFLDLRMRGIEEDRQQLKPQDFSGYKILKSIKEINPGIQIIMLTATNKGWNVKAILDAGANGYYMKESPEYHFSEDYSLQNAINFEENIRYCRRRAYLMDIYQSIKNFRLNEDNSLDRAIKNQLEISFDLINKASSQSEFAFAYISLEQVYEIVSQHLFKEIRDDGGWSFGFDQPDEYSLKEANQYFKLYPDTIKNSTPVWVKIAAIYKMLFEGVDSNFISNVKEDIEIRNKYIHDREKPVITEEDFQNLFDSIQEFLSVYV